MSLQGFADALPVACLVVGRDARISIANARAIDLLGTGLVDRHYVTMLRQPDLVEAIDGTLADGSARTSRFQSRDGAQDTMYQVTCHAAGATGVVVCFEDITQIEQASKTRRDFVANVSHELRTPLTALMGFIDTLQGPARDDPPARDRFLEIMAAEAGRMNRLVGDLLSLSRVEGLERVRPTAEVVLADVLSSVELSLRPIATKAGVTIVLDNAPAELRLTGDADHLTQVFTNLTENAIKYGGPDKQVHLSAEYVARDRILRVPAVCVSVRDQGSGIDPVHLPRLTERFYRADAHRSRELGGTGLGLAIVKHMINRHRGRLTIESTPGQGSVFTVFLPCHERP